MEIDTKTFKEKLEAEKETLKEEMKKIARINDASKKEDWEARGTDFNIQQSDQNERAESQEEYELNNTLLKDIELRYNNVKEALKRIEDGIYGVCKIDNKPIELDRLEANPAATTCEKHIDKE